MKKIIYLLVIGCFLNSAAKSQGTFNDQLKKHYLDVYHQSVLYNDAKTAIGALQGYIALENTEKNPAYKDTLSMLYFATQSYYTALMLSQEVLKADPDNVNTLARSAECFQNLGDAKNAVTAYEQVVQKVKNPYYNYQLGLVQFQLKRIAESESNLKIVLADTNSNKIAVPFPLPNGSVQDIPASAGALNILGIIQMDAKNTAQAKKYFEEALKLYPSFAGAQQNLQYLTSLENKKTTPPAKNKSKQK